MPKLDQRDFHAEMSQSIGHFDSDEARPDDYSRLRVNALQERFHAERIFHAVKLVYAGDVEPLNPGPHGHRTGPDHEPVVCNTLGGSVRSAHRYRFLPNIDIPHRA